MTATGDESPKVKRIPQSVIWLFTVPPPAEYMFLRVVLQALINVFLSGTMERESMEGEWYEEIHQ